MVDNNESLRTTKATTAANVMPPAAENSHVENTLQKKKSDTQRSTPKVLSLQEYFDFITPDKQVRILNEPYCTLIFILSFIDFIA